jgi:hypothetical protein
VKKIDLAPLLEEVVNFNQCLGPAENQILEYASILLRSQIPTEEAPKVAYLTRSTQTQSDLINLSSRISYVQMMKTHERDTYLGKLIENEEYPAKDRHYLALQRDSVYRDLCEIVETLEIVKKTINELLWSLKMAVRKV